MSPPVPISDVTDAISRWSRTRLPQVALEPRRPGSVTDDRRDLDLVHREDHAACPAATAELERRAAMVSKREPATAVLGRDEGSQRALRAECVQRLGREPRLAVDAAGVRRSDLVGDPPDRRQEGLVSLDRDGRHAGDPERLERLADELTLWKTVRFSIASGNSISKAASRASIRFTLACDVIPA